MISSMKILSFFALVVASVSGCGDFDVSIQCTKSGTDEACATLTAMQEPHLTCNKGCATSVELVYTGTPCRGPGQESDEVRLCQYNVHHEDCEENDAEGNDWMTPCLEYKPSEAFVTAKSPSGAILFMGNVAEGDQFTLTNGGGCIPNEIMMEAVEVEGHYEATGVDFRHSLDIVFQGKPTPNTDYGAFKLKSPPCTGKTDVFFSETNPADCLVDVDISVCVATNSDTPMHMRYEELFYNKVSLMTEMFTEDEAMTIDGHTQFCRSLTTQMDVCRKKHDIDYAFGIHNYACAKRTVLEKTMFLLK